MHYLNRRQVIQSIQAELLRKTAEKARSQKLIRGLPGLHPGQLDVYSHPARFKILACGRRWGKTALAVRLLVERAAVGERVAYFGLSATGAAEVWNECKAHLEPVAGRVDNSARRIDTKSGGVLEMWYEGNVQRSRGRKYHYIVVDEAAHWRGLEQVWSGALAPLLTDYRGGAMFASTPNGRNGFFNLYGRGVDPGYEAWAAWRSSSYDNPYLSGDEIDMMQRDLPERFFRQEYLAEFLESAGSVFRGVADVAILEVAAPYSGEFVAGVDWGRSNDFTVVCVFDRSTRRMVDMERFNQIGWTVQRERVVNMCRRWRVVSVLAEQNSIGDVNIEALQMEGLPVRPFQTTAASKPALINRLVMAIEKQTVYLLDDDVLKNELQAYMIERSPAGNWKYNAPEGGHDDTVIATALGVWAMDDIPQLVLW